MVLSNMFSKIFGDNSRRWLVVLYAILIILETAAISSEDTSLSQSSSSLRMIFRLFFYFCTLLCILVLASRKRRVNNKDILIAVIFYWILSVFHTANGADVSFSFLSNIQLVIFCFLLDEEQASIFKILGVYLTIVCALGIIAYLSFFTPFFNLPYTIDSYYGSENRSDVFYINYGFSYLVGTSFSMVRLCGLFNEPGYLGSVCALYLCADKMKLTKWNNIIILVATIFTFSLASFAIFAIYFLFSFRKNKTVLIYAVLAVVAFIFIANKLGTETEAFEHIIERTQVENGSLAGDNRVHDNYQRALDEQKRDMDALLFGYGNGIMQIKHLDGASYKNFIISYGYIGFVLIYVLLIIPAFKRAKGYYLAIVFMILFFVNSYQRPYMFNPLYFAILFGGINYIKEMKDS